MQFAILCFELFHALFLLEDRLCYLAKIVSVHAIIFPFSPRKVTSSHFHMYAREQAK